MPWPLPVEMGTSSGPLYFLYRLRDKAPFKARRPHGTWGAVLFYRAVGVSGGFWGFSVLWGDGSS